MDLFIDLGLAFNVWRCSLLLADLVYDALLHYWEAHLTKSTFYACTSYFHMFFLQLGFHLEAYYFWNVFPRDLVLSPSTHMQGGLVVQFRGRNICILPNAAQLRYLDLN